MSDPDSNSPSATTTTTTFTAGTPIVQPVSGMRDMLRSERSTLVLLLVIAVTVLTAIGKVSADDWLTYTKWLATILVTGKTFSHIAETIAKPQPATATATVVEK